MRVPPPLTADDDEPIVIIETQPVHAAPTPPLSPHTHRHHVGSTASFSTASSSAITPRLPVLHTSQGRNIAFVDSNDRQLAGVASPSPPSSSVSASPSPSPSTASSATSPRRRGHPSITVPRTSLSSTASSLTSSSPTPSHSSLSFTHKDELNYIYGSPTRATSSPFTFPNTPTPSSPLGSTCHSVSTPTSMTSYSTSSSSSSLSSNYYNPHYSPSSSTTQPSMSAEEVARLIEVNAKLQRENSALRTSLSRASSRRSSIESNTSLEPSQLFPPAATSSASLPPPSYNMSLSAPSVHGRGGGERRYGTAGAETNMRINSLRREMMAAAAAAAGTGGSRQVGIHHSLTTANSSDEDDDERAGSVVDRTRSLPLKGGVTRLHRKTAPADLAAMMNEWRLMEDKRAAQATESLQRRESRPVVAANAQSDSDSDDDSDSTDDSEDEKRRKHRHATGGGHKRSGGGRSKEQSDEERRKSWTRGEATMNHAEVRMMMEMMSAAKTPKAATTPSGQRGSGGGGSVQ